MSDPTRQTDAAPARPAARRATLGTYARYHWFVPIVHAVLLVFGVINLYPFIWMLGTSLKAEKEASSERMSPVPGRKYKLSPGFRFRKILPVDLQPGLDEAMREVPERQEAEESELREPTPAEKHYRDLLEGLQKKLKLIARMQIDAWPGEVGHQVKALLGKDSPHEPGELLVQFVAVGLLDKTDLGCWLPEKADGPGAAAGLEGVPARVFEGIRRHLTVTPQEAANITAQDKAKVDRMLAVLVDKGVLVAVKGVEADPEAPVSYRLAERARQRVTAGGLYPRQILTLWEMRDENIRRHESRETFAKDRRAVGDYADEKHTVRDKELAARELAELAEGGYLVSGTLLPINYWVVLKEENFLLRFMTSVVITVFVVIAVVLMSSMLGYALASLKFPGKFLVLGVMIGASILPGEARIIPIFKMLLSVGMLNNLWGIVVWLTSFGVGNALLMAGFFLTLPHEIHEAAAVDGAGPYRTFFDIALPMARPIVTTVGMFAFLSSWNNFLVPLLCTIARPSMQPLAVAVYNFQQGHQGKWHHINAAASVMIIPVILLFLLVQRHVVKSIAVGALKG